MFLISFFFFFSLITKVYFPIGIHPLYLFRIDVDDGVHKSVFFPEISAAKEKYVRQGEEIVLLLKTMMFRKQPEGKLGNISRKNCFRGSGQADLWNILTQYMLYIVVLFLEVSLESDSIWHG